LGSTQDVKSSKALFIRAKAFMQVAKKGKAFHDLPTSNVELLRHEILSQYKEFKDVFEKKNVNTLSKHYPYDCMIALEEGAQLPFGPIYNLSKDEFATFCEYINETLKMGSFNIPSL
jgi:hypothetical protein